MDHYFRYALVAIILTVTSNARSDQTGTSYQELLRVLDGEWLYPLNEKEVHECAMIRIANEMRLQSKQEVIIPSCFEKDKHMSLRYPNNNHVVVMEHKETIVTSALRIEAIPSGIEGIAFGKIDMTTVIPVEKTMNLYFSPLLNHMRSASIGGFIVNLCGNGGGDVHGAAAFLRYFAPISVETESPLFEIRRRDNTIGDNDHYVALKAGVATNECVVVLVNKDTASAAEIIAYVLQSWRAYVVGEVTYKKGTAQTIRTLRDGAILKFTYGRIFFADGTTIDQRGVIPDYITSEPHMQWEQAHAYLRQCYAKKNSHK